MNSPCGGVSSQSNGMNSVITANSYGKGRVRVTKVKRLAHVHEVAQYDIEVQLEGEFEASYTMGDNRLVVATDTIKNNCYALASEHPCNDPESFAIDLARNFLRRYKQVQSATIELTQDLYDRIAVSGSKEGHPTAWTHRGPEKRWVKAVVRRDRRPRVWTGIVGLSVLRTQGSEWADFHTDEMRTLKDTKDRLLATVVDARWEWNTWDVASFNETYTRVRSIIADIFANHHSLGAQHTMYKIAEECMRVNPFIEVFRMVLPNVHHIPYDLSRLGGRQNRNEIFIATSEPFGLIKVELTRSRSASKL